MPIELTFQDPDIEIVLRQFERRIHLGARCRRFAETNCCADRSATRFDIVRFDFQRPFESSPCFLKAADRKVEQSLQG